MRVDEQLPLIGPEQLDLFARFESFHPGCDGIACERCEKRCCESCGARSVYVDDDYRFLCWGCRVGY
jgi:hypothetical protein